MTDAEEILMTRYLFGELPEAEQTHMEERYFADKRIFDQVAQLETRLLDDYARGRLPAPMRERLERAYLSNPNRRARLQLSGALTARADQAVASATAQPRVRPSSLWRSISSLLPGRPLVLGVSLSALLLFSLAAVWLWIQNQRLREELAQARDAQNLQLQQQSDIERQLIAERDKTQKLTAELERARPNASFHPVPVGPLVASLELTVDEGRGTGTTTPPTLVVPKGARQVRLLLKRSENEYQSYALVLQAVDGKEVLNRPHLKPVTSKSGAMFILTIPSSLIGTGDYILTLRGQMADGELEDLSQSLFRLDKK